MREGFQPHDVTKTFCCFGEMSENSNLLANMGVNSRGFYWEPIMSYVYVGAPVCLSMHVCMLEKERRKAQISLHLVYCSDCDVVVSILLYCCGGGDFLCCAFIGNSSCVWW